MKFYDTKNIFTFYDEVRDQNIPTVKPRNIKRDITSFINHRIVMGDRIDLLAEKYYGDPTKYWIIMDYNDLLCPFDLTNYAGDYLKIPEPFEVSVR